MLVGRLKKRPSSIGKSITLVRNLFLSFSLEDARKSPAGNISKNLATAMLPENSALINLNLGDWKDENIATSIIALNQDWRRDGGQTCSWGLDSTYTRSQ